MRDVRGVFIDFLAVAAVLGAVALVIVARRRGTERAHSWGAVRGGALGLIAVLVLGGVVSFVAFDALFETFHRIFFAGGSYTFDPATERLVQLFPFQFWQETAIVVGAVCIMLAGLVAVVATGRLSASAGEPAELADGPATSLRATGSSR